MIYCSNKFESNKLIGSKQFAIVAKINNKDSTNIEINKSSIMAEFQLDSNLKGTIALMNYTPEGYCFQKSKIKKMD